MENEQLWTISDLAGVLRVHRTQVYRLIDRGLPFVLLGNRQRRFVPQDVRDWLRSNTVTVQDEARERAAS